MAVAGSRFAVVSALAGNALVMVAKFVAFSFTGSGAMLSEGIHSVADVLNQALLMVGVVRSEREPDEDHPYGYAPERYVWALISAVGIFFLGCGVTLYHGISQLLRPEHHEVVDLTWAFGVLLMSLVIEGAVLVFALRAAWRQAKGRPFFKFLREEADVATVAVILEDSAACLGVIFALAAILLTRLTGQQYWDAFGSIAIGLLLGGVAVWLIAKNHQLLVGEAIPPHVKKQVLRILEENPLVEEVVDFRSRMLDSETYRIKADIHFNGEALAKKLSERIQTAYDEIKSREDFEKFAVRYADEVVDLLADEIDLLEARIRAVTPKAQHVDLEAD
ncbi:cation diffusion facilitator family transporter [Lignipirellula cremea]|uniref:Ferrous iron efflux protein F n=1 Tax=Lignipirellula cremea TaxID=2528010 RepID=A0A518DWX3_9BACT|nr:cation diffusion facilitator family transporter [Lignipirellula cremea]QDU96338.1 ferrous iron efflux protein F [Lignipirellula cremea]